MKLRLPKLKLASGGKKRKKYIMVTTITVAATVAVFVILYTTNRSFKNKIDEIFKIGDVAKLGPIVDRAENVNFSIPDDRVAPNSSFEIVGEFTNADGSPVRVRQALYYIVDAEKGNRLITQGIIGTNVGKFSKTIGTSGFPAGSDYDVIVSDETIDVNELQSEEVAKGGVPIEIAQRSGSNVGGVSGLT